MDGDLLLQLGAALLAGALIGAERESRDKAAGFRTMALISLGSALFTELSIRIGGDANRARIAAQIVSGVGFLGAGVIMRDGRRVSGLTTAATVWLTASLGMAFGAGYFGLGFTGTGLTLLVLLLFPLVEGFIDSRREQHEYRVSTSSLGAVDRITGLIGATHLRILDHHVERTGDAVTARWEVIGRQRNHRLLTDALLTDPELTSVSR
jgi:putative Mg2+ transporter-C (MgtC) family protein